MFDKIKKHKRIRMFIDELNKFGYNISSYKIISIDEAIENIYYNRLIYEQYINISNQRHFTTEDIFNFMSEYLFRLSELMENLEIIILIKKGIIKDTVYPIIISNNSERLISVFPENMKKLNTKEKSVDFSKHYMRNYLYINKNIEYMYHRQFEISKISNLIKLESERDNFLNNEIDLIVKPLNGYFESFLYYNNNLISRVVHNTLDTEIIFEDALYPFNLDPSFLKDINKIPEYTTKFVDEMKAYKELNKMMII